ncbi:HAD family hydrolase [Neobacillus vireti]|uniref:HAD family hydrolase n=1 Tax=Neobacillus vireti TaxID=220686 RepID=UPI002FFDA800
MKINAIVFDLDDTLYKESDYVFSGFRSVDKWLRDFYEIRGFYSIATRLFNEGVRKNIFNKTLENLNFKFNENIIKSMVNIYRTHDPKIKLLEDANWAMGNLQNSVKLGLISDGYLITQQKKINALNINGIFDSIILTDSYGRKNWKPSPIPYIKAVEQLSCSHVECLYIGDNITKDFITAKKLGWKTVHIRRVEGIYFNTHGSQDYHAHYEIKDLRELPNISEFRHLFN